MLLVAIALVVQAPAWLLGRIVQEHSGGLVELRHASGTLWKGEADAHVRAQNTGAREVSVGGISWRLGHIDWQRRALLFAVRQTPAEARTTTVAIAADRIRVTGSVRLPAAVGGHVALLKGWVPGGAVVIDSDGLEWARGSGTGTGTVHWHNATLIPPDLPGGLSLGEVTARVTLDGASVVASMRNSGGVIELTGDASSQSGNVVLMLQPRAGASGAQIAWLQSHTMGRTPQGFTIATGWPGR